MKRKADLTRLAAPLAIATTLALSSCGGLQTPDSDEENISCETEAVEFKNTVQRNLGYQTVTQVQLKVTADAEALYDRLNTSTDTDGAYQKRRLRTENGEVLIECKVPKGRLQGQTADPRCTGQGKAVYSQCGISLKETDPNRIAFAENKIRFESVESTSETRQTTVAQIGFQGDRDSLVSGMGLSPTVPFKASNRAVEIAVIGDLVEIRALQYLLEKTGPAPQMVDNR